MTLQAALTVSEIYGPTELRRMASALLKSRMCHVDQAGPAVRYRLGHLDPVEITSWIATTTAVVAVSDAHLARFDQASHDAGELIGDALKAAVTLEHDALAYILAVNANGYPAATAIVDQLLERLAMIVNRGPSAPASPLALRTLRLIVWDASQSVPSEQLCEALNAYQGDNYWQDVVEPSDYDRAATEQLSDDDIRIGSRTVTYCASSGFWSVSAE